MGGLSAQELAELNERGFLLVRGALDPADLAPLIAEIEAAIDTSARALHAAGKLPSPFAELGFDERLARITEHSTAAFKALWSGNHHGPALFDLLRHRTILSLVEPLVGPEIWCHPAYRIRPKLPDLPRTAQLTTVPWHQDSSYMSAPSDAVMIPTVWIPLNRSTDENGCLELIPWRHDQGICRHRHVQGQPYLEIAPDALPEGPRVLVPAEAGDVLLLTNISVHRSRPNRTRKMRWSVDVRYHDPAGPSGYPLETGFLVRSRERPEAVVTSAEEFARIRTSPAQGEAPRLQRWAVEG
jgi:ectoine hydroxylase-related dioxygenase (phytanoyl-CoA dioxygenase family)